MLFGEGCREDFDIARGPIVQEAALVDALQRGVMRGAGLDVYDEEPLPDGHPLTNLDNVVLTPHIGWSRRRPSPASWMA